MKPTKLLFVITTLVSSITFAQTKNRAPSASGGSDQFFGVGIALGNPSALTGKMWLDDTAAIDMGLAFSFDDYILVYGDYLHHFHDVFPNKNKFVSELTPYLGGGALIAMTTKDTSRDESFRGKNKSSLGLGVRVPVGIEWRPKNPTIGVHLELVPGISIAPKTDSFIQGQIGIRYYF